MKPFAFVIIGLWLLAPGFSLADNLLRNGDFSDGTAHWEGDIRSTPGNDDAPADPFAQQNSDSSTPKGAFVHLRPGAWTKIVQHFTGRGAAGLQISVTYSLSADTTFSEEASDYRNVPAQIGFTAWMAFDGLPGQVLIFISDLGKATGTYTQFRPKVGSTAADTVHMGMEHAVSNGDKTICIAFPPGKGTVNLLNVSIE